MNNENYFLNYTKVSSIYVLVLAVAMAIGFYFQSQDKAYSQLISSELSEELMTEIQENKALEIENKALEIENKALCSDNSTLQMENEEIEDSLWGIQYEYDDIIYVLANEDCPGPLYEHLENFKKTRERICSLLKQGKE
jgi:hypothetical protein